MKKRIALILAMTLCLSLAACGGSGSGQTAAPEPEETPAAAPDPRQEQYEAALAALENEDYAAAYAAFEALGDYEDAAEYLSRFTVEKRLEKEGDCRYTYSSDGKILSRVGFSELTYYFRLPWEPDAEGGQMDYEYDGDRLKTVTAEMTSSADSQWTDQGTQQEYIEKLGGVLGDDGIIRMKYKDIYTYSYDESGKVSAVELVRGGYDPVTYTMEYGENGELIRVSSNEEHPFDANLLYDENGNLTAVEKSPEQGEEMSGGMLIAYEYDGEGRVTKMTESFANAGTFEEKNIDENGNVNIASQSFREGPLYTAEYTYGEDENTVSVNLTFFYGESEQFTLTYSDFYTYNAA